MLSFNTPHKGNTLTHSSLDYLHRNFINLDRDSEAKGILWIGSQEMFSYGTDYLYLAKATAEGKDVKPYLQMLTHLTYQAAQLETPTLTFLAGKALGSAASISSLTHYPVTTSNTLMSFPETSFGFIPTGGASYVLSRLQGELGMYLALTGKFLKGSDAVHAGLASFHSELTDFFWENLILSISGYQQPLGSQSVYGDVWLDVQTEKLLLDEKNLQKSRNELFNRTNLDKYWRERRENIKMVMADIYFKDQLREESSRESPFKSYKGFTGQPIENHLLDFENKVINQIDWENLDPFSIRDALPAIYRCFCAPSLSEALERLTIESQTGKTEWAKQTLELLSKKSPLALELTWKLINSAKNLEFAEVLQLEYTVAQNLVSHPDFLEGTVKLLSRNNGVPDWSVNFPVPQSLVEQMFETKDQVELESRKNELLPVKEWYRDFPQSIRFWLNERSPDSHYQRKDFEFDVKSFLTKFEIDARDQNVEVTSVRKGFFLAEKVSKSLEEKDSQLLRMASDSKTAKTYVEERKNVIEKMFENEAELKQKVNSLIEERFLEKYKERIQTIQKKAKEAHEIEKKQLLKELKDFVHRNYFLEPTQLPSRIYEHLEKDYYDIPMQVHEDNNKSYIEDLVASLPEKPQISPDLYPTSNFFSIEDYRFYFMQKSERFLHKSIGNNLQEAMHKLWNVMAEFSKTLDQQKFDCQKAYEKASTTETLSLHYPETITFPEVEDQFKEEFKREIYVKTGCKSVKEGLNLMKTNFVPDMEEIRKRRIEVIHEDRLKNDDHIYHPDPNRVRLKNLFSELYIKPSVDELNDEVLEILEIDSIYQVMEEIERRLNQRQKGKPIIELDKKGKEKDLKEEVDELYTLLIEDSHENILKNYPFRVELDRRYVEAIYGKEAYMPKYLNFQEDTLESTYKSLDFCDLRKKPQEWAEEALKSIINSYFDKRFEVEKSMTRQELKAYDQELSQKLTPKALKPQMHKALESEIGLILWSKQLSEKAKQEEDSAKLENYFQEPLVQENFKKKLHKHLILQAFNYESYVRRIRELNKEKSDELYDEEDFNLLQEILEHEDPEEHQLKSEREYAQKWQPFEYQSNLFRKFRNREQKSKLKRLEEEMEKNAKVYKALEQLVKREDMRKKIKDPEAFMEVYRNSEKY